MDCIKKVLIIIFILSSAGCLTFNRKDKAFETGYKTGVKENLESFAERFYGNDFPYFYWQSPIVQNVTIPGHIENGVFIPEHNEPVVIEPGSWRKEFGYPINCPNTQNPSKEGGEPYAFNYLDFSSRDLTVLPESFVCAERGTKGKDSDRGIGQDPEVKTANP